MGTWRIGILLLVFQLLFSPACYAQEAGSTPSAQPLDLNLSSTDKSVSAASVLQSATQATINLSGNTTRTVGVNDMLTPAEMVAVRQVLNTGQQYLQLNDLGAAVGGGLRLNYYAANGISNLVIPENVRATQNAAVLQSLNLSGNLTNSGTFNVYSSNAAVTAATVNATNIYNNVGATIASTLANLNLNAINNIVNLGTIRSTGNLNLTAGGTIYNASSAGVMAMMQANNISMVANNIVNSGTIQALTGNLNIASQMAHNLAVNNTGGLLSALNGQINMSTNGTAAQKLAMDLLGGDLRAQAVNLTTLKGTANVNVKELTGVLNTNVGALHLTAATPKLTLGNLQITGDPTFYNTAGDIEITQDIDLRPVNFVPPGPVSLAIVAFGNVYADPGVQNINISAVPNSIFPADAWPGSTQGGDVVIIAGAPYFTATPTDGSVTQVTVPAPTNSNPWPLPAAYGDYTNTLTIYQTPPAGSPTPTGGDINLANVTINTTSSYPGQNANGGNVLLTAFSGNTHQGNINVGSIVTGEVPQNGTGDNSGKNGWVTAIAANNLTIGSINTTGNYVNSSINSGNVTLFSGGVKFLQSSQTQLANTFLPNYSEITNTIVPSGFTQFTVSDTTNINSGTVLYLDPLGPNSETVTVSQVNGSTITVSAPLQNTHVNTEHIFINAPTDPISGSPIVVINPGAGFINPGPGSEPVTPVFQNGEVLAPDLTNVGSGVITVGQIQSGGMVTINTSGTVNLNGSISLTQNPTAQSSPGAPTQYLRFPAITVTGTNGVVVDAPQAGNVVISSEIASCPLCFNSVNINTESLTVNSNDSVIGFVVNIVSGGGNALSLTNNGTITGGGTQGGASINAFVNIQGSGGMQLSGTGTIQTPGVVSVIDIGVGDGNLLSLTSSMNFSLGTQGLVMLNAQRQGGSVSLGTNSVLNFTGTPLLIINTPGLSLANGSGVTGVSTMAVSSGLAVSPTDGVTPLAMTVTLANNANVSLSATNVNMRPLDGAQLNLVGPGATLTLSGSMVLAASQKSLISIDNSMTISGTYESVGSPSGGITAIAFQPYVGPFISGPVGYTNYASYSYQQVLAMLGPIAASQQFQGVATYTQGISAVPPNSSTAYVIQASKEMGLKVSAGIFIEMNTSGAVTSAVDSNGNPIDLVPVLQAAAQYGNVIDIVMGNEDIVGGANPTASIQTLTNLISDAQTLRASYTNPITSSAFTSANLPITTRQVGGVFDIVNSDFGNPAATAAMIALLNQVDGYAYGNFYPFFNTDVVAALTCPSCSGYAYNYIGMNASQNQFTTLVQTNMSAQYNKVSTDVTSTNPGVKIRIGETGWGAVGSPQASATYQQYYYPAMQDWSYKNNVPIYTYFESYNEPWKPVDKGPPGSTPGNLGATVTLSQPSNPGDTQIFVNSPAQLLGVSQIVIYPAPQRVTATTPPPYYQVTPPEEFANLQPQAGGGSNNPWQLFSPLQNAHNAGDIVNVGAGSEDNFGIWIANGTSPGGPAYLPATTYQLNSITQNFNLPLYRTGGSGLTNLDLTNPATVTILVNGQTAGTYGGTLIVTSGVATGGTLVLQNNDLASTLTQINIPANVTVTFDRLKASSLINVALTTATPVTVNGTLILDGTDVNLPDSQPSLTIGTTNTGNVFTLGSTGSLSFTNAPLGNFLLAGAGPMTIGGAVTGNFTLQTTAQSGSITVSSSIGSPTSNLTFVLDGSGTLQQTAGVIAAGILTLTGTAVSFGTSLAALNTNATTLSANTTRGSINLSNIGNLTLNPLSANENLTVATTGTMTLTGVLTARTDINLKAGNIIIAGPVTLNAANVSLQSTAGDIGSLGSNVNTSAQVLNVSTGGGNAYINSTGVLALGNVELPGGTLIITNDKLVRVPGAIANFGGLTVISAAGSNTKINVSGPIGNAAAFISFNAGGDGEIEFSQTVTANTIALSSVSGKITGTVNAANMTVTTGPSAYVELRNAGSAPIQVGASAGVFFDLTSKGDIVADSITTSAGSIRLTAETGQLSVSSGSTLTANAGRVTLNAMSSDTGTILLDTSSAIVANGAPRDGGNGRIIVFTGPTYTEVNQVAPANVTSVVTPPGRIFYGANSITANLPLNTITANGKDITFSGNITLNGSVDISGEQIGFSQRALSKELVVDTGECEIDFDWTDSEILVNR